MQEGKICIRKNVFQDKKKTIIFVHGLSGNLSAWSEYEKIFQKNYNIIMYDLRGHGKSLRYTSCDDYAIQNFSKDLNYIVKYFSIDKFLLVSHSFGTLVAIDYLLIHQEKIEKSIFLAPNFNVREKWLL